MNKISVMVLAAVMRFSLRVAAQDTASQAKPAIDAAVAAMEHGRAFSRFNTRALDSSTLPARPTNPEGPWPRYCTLKKYTMSVNYTAPAMRQEVVRIDDERPPRGGGVGGFNPVTFQGGIRPAPGEMVENQNTDGRTEAVAVRIWLTPHGFLKVAAANIATAKTSVVSMEKLWSHFSAFGKYTV